MKKFIVTTTINSPTEATQKFCDIADKKDFIFVIVGDTKTPHDEYEKLVEDHKNVVYLTPDVQDELYPALSEIIGWKTIQRRNIGFVFAYQNGADIVATVDDDNIPYSSWGDNILLGQEIEVDEYENISCPYFDAISTTEHNDLWHRGFPIEYLQVKNNIEYKGKTKITPMRDVMTKSKSRSSIVFFTYKITTLTKCYTISTSPPANNCYKSIK
jgi:hypothetical protein